MFQTPTPLNPKAHANLKLSHRPDYRFTATHTACPVVSGEMWAIAREYIMVFPRQAGDLPLALLGTQPDVNAYLGDGNPPWWGRYIPAHFRRYPFVTAPLATDENAPEGEQRFVICVDSSAPQLSETQGQPLFTAEGQATDLLLNVEKALKSLQHDFVRTRQLVAQIEQHELLAERTLTIHHAQGEPTGIKGFRVVDQSKFRQLPGETLAELAQTGALDLIYAHIGSLSNIQDGLLAKRAQGMNASRTLDDGADVGTLFGEQDDTLKFEF